MKGFKHLLLVALILTVALTQGLLTTSRALAATNGKESATVEVIGNQGAVLQSSTPVTISGSTTALDALKSAVGSTQVDEKSGMIIGIKGVKSPSDWSAYWSFYINGVSAPIGAGSYTVNNQDNLLFEYHQNQALNNEVSVTIPDKTYKTTSLYVQVGSTDTVLSVLKKMEPLYHVTLSNNQIKAIGSFQQDQTHSWSIKETQNKTTATVKDLTQKVQPGEQLTFDLRSVAPTQSSTTGSSSIKPKTVSSSDLAKAIKLGTQYVDQHGISEWEAIALARTGHKVPSTYLKGVSATVKSSKGQFHAITDTERYTLGILAAGGDPTSISGYNLVKNIYNGDVTKQGLNGVAFGLISLESTNFSVPSSAKWTTNKLVTKLLNAQNADGGWAWDGSKTSDLDTTGMVITALSKQSSQPKVKAAITKAESYLKTQFQKGNVDNSSTASQLVIGLTANGVSPESSSYTLKDGTTLMSYLLSFQQKDGGFDWKSKDESTFSTQQAFLALAADQLYQNKKASLYTFTWKKASEQNAPAPSPQKGASLPNTATPYYNYILLGAILVIAGLLLARQTKRKRV